MVGFRWGRAVLAGLVGGVVFSLVTFLLFGALGSPILFNPQIQSRKLIEVWRTIAPLPLAITNPAAFLAGASALGLLRGLLFAWFYEGIPGQGLRKGLAWGFATWIIFALFFEFFTPFNLFGEPLQLVALELSFWLVGFSVEGLTFAGIYGRRTA